MFRRCVIAMLLAANCTVVVALSGSSFTAVTSAPTEVAARWYHRARQGGLHYRSTTRGRSWGHTAVPLSVQHW